MKFKCIWQFSIFLALVSSVNSHAQNKIRKEEPILRSSQGFVQGKCRAFSPYDDYKHQCWYGTGQSDFIFVNDDKVWIDKLFNGKRLGAPVALGEVRPDMVQVFVGFEGDDIIRGSMLPNKIWGGEGKDILWGGPLEDSIIGNEGDDTIAGFGGDDKLWGREGHDTIYGCNGNDNISDYAGDDKLYGDQCILDDDYNNLDNSIEERVGENSPLTDRERNEVTDSTGSNDVLYSGKGDDLVEGGPGNDDIHTSEGDDIVNGGEGEDKIFAEGGDDTVHGNIGNDFIDGGDGFNKIWGDAGDDTIRCAADAGRIIITNEEGKNKVIETGDDKIDGGDGNDTINGGTGKDEIVDNSGINIIFGDASDDKFYLSDCNQIRDGQAGEPCMANNIVRYFNSGKWLTLAELDKKQSEDLAKLIKEIEAENKKWEKEYQRLVNKEKNSGLR